MTDNIFGSGHIKIAENNQPLWLKKLLCGEKVKLPFGFGHSLAFQKAVREGKISSDGVISVKTSSTKK